MTKYRMPWLLALPLLLSPRLNGQMRGSDEKTAAVDVVAFEASGRFLGAPEIRVFEKDVQHNWANRFHGGVATAIPYGVYRVEGRLPGYFSDVRYVRVYSPRVTIVLGLRFGSELPETLPG